MAVATAETITGTATEKAVLQDGDATFSIVRILVELANSVTFKQSFKCRRGDQGVLPAEPTPLMGRASVSPTANPAVGLSSHEPLRMRRKRRRDVLNVFFSSDSKTSSSLSSPLAIRKYIHQLFQNAKENFGKISATHAAMLELLCGIVVPGIENGAPPTNDAYTPELSVAEQMLYIILRTSTAAVSTWVKPQIVPRCWLSPSIITVVERSVAVQRTMRWSCDPDPVIAAALGVDMANYDSSLIWSATSYHMPQLVSSYTDGVNLFGDVQSSWCMEESEDVRKLVAGKRSHAAVVGMDEQESPSLLEQSGAMTARASSPPDAAAAWPFKSFFREEYPSSSPFCSLLYVALHRGIVGQQDPYMLLLRLDPSEDVPLSHASKLSLEKASSRSQEFAASRLELSLSGLCINISPEFLLAAGDHNTGEDNEGEAEERKHGKNKKRRRASVCEGGEMKASSFQCSRGVMTMLQWSCQSGTLFLRLQHLCEVSEKPEWRAALGQYGKSAIEALRRLLLFLQRIVAEMADRPGGPHGVSFGEFLSAQQRLRLVSEDIMALSDAFYVHAGADWDASVALGALSSATFLSSLYRRYAQLTINNRGYPPHAGATDTVLPDSIPLKGPDVIGAVFLAALFPLHHMMGMWLREGELQDPYDEFFILPSHGTNACGFLVDTSAQRLPEFISTEAAEEILHAGISLRVLRATVRHVTSCAKKEQKRLEVQTEDVDAASTFQNQAQDAIGIDLLLHDFIDSLLGHRSPSHFPPAPEVNLLLAKGALSHWKTFYKGCNDVLLSTPEEEKCSSDRDEIEPVQLGVILQTDTEKGEASFKSTSVVERRGGARSLTSSCSRLSRATTMWHEAVSLEMTRVVRARDQEEEIKTKARAALRSEYELQMVRREAKRQLQQWKAQRFSLHLERRAAMSRCVDDLLELYATVLKPGNPDDVKTNEEAKCEEDRHPRSQTPIGKFVKPLHTNLPPPLGKSVVAQAREKPPLGAGITEKGEKGAYVQSVSSPRRAFFPLSLQRRSGTEIKWKATKTTEVGTTTRTTAAAATSTGVVATASASVSLQSLPKEIIIDDAGGEPCELKHPPEMYVVSDINDDEHLMKRAGPQESRADATEALYAQLAVLEARVQGCDVSSEVYQRECAEVALEALRSADSNATAGCSKHISAVWWTDPTADEGDIGSFKGITSAISSVVGARELELSGKEANNAINTTLVLTEQQAKSLLNCPYYYLTLGRFTASYLTHKALQVMLLGPYGTLYRLMQQLLNVCLMQSGHVADRLTEIWRCLSAEAIEGNQFNASTVFATFNRVFVEEWESCVVQGQDTLKVRLALFIPNKSDDDVKGKSHLRVNVEDSGGGDGHILPKGMRFQRGARHATSGGMVEGKEEGGDEDNLIGLGSDSDVAPLPDNPFDFIARLTIVHESPCKVFWVLPERAISVYSDLFSTLLFWTSVKQLVTRVWYVGIRSGVGEAFFFCNVSRAVLNAVVQHIWFLISGHAREYSNTLNFNTGVFYSYRKLESFTADHAVFLERCRFAAMLTPVFAEARQQVYGMVQQLEEVEQTLLRAEREDAEDRVALCSAASGGAGEAAASSGQLKRVNAEQVGKRKRKQSKVEKCEGRELSKKRLSSSDYLLSSQSSFSSVGLESVSQLNPVESSELQLEVSQRMGVRRRAIRRNLQCRLRSFVGLTEKFVSHLSSILNRAAVDAAVMFPKKSEMKGCLSLRDTMRTSESATSLKSLIRTLEMTQAAVEGKL